VLSLSPIKLMVIVAVALLLLGPDKLPEVAHRLGSSWRALKRLQEKVEAEVHEAIPDLPSASDIARIVRSPVNILNQLADRAEARDEASAVTAADETTNEDSGPDVAFDDEPPIDADAGPTTPVAYTDYAPMPDDPSLN
jgi:TatA/E family protein of Tat protein translocase